MIEFREVWEDEEFVGWRYREKMPSGMTLEYGFYEVGDEEKPERADINVELVVFRKRGERWVEPGAVTGRDGAYTLARARTIHKRMEVFVLHRLGHLCTDIVIRVSWDDNRRRNIYARGLVPMGYHFSGTELVKHVKRDGVDKINMMPYN